MTNENYEVPIELVKVFGRLVKNYTLIIERNEKRDIKELASILRDIDKYKTLIGTKVYMERDMINDQELNELEKKCNEFLESNQEIIDKSSKRD